MDLETGPTKGEEKVTEPLLFGFFAVSKEQVFRILVCIYSIFFAVHRIADIAYLVMVDAKFPKGLEHLYESEADREMAVSYTRQMVTCNMLKETAEFFIVFAFVWFGIPAKLDEGLQRMFSSIGERLAPYAQFFNSCHGCCCCPCSLCGPTLSFSDLIRGALFLQIVAGLFFLVTAPFKVWSYQINVNFGFLNVLNLPFAKFSMDLIKEFFALFTTGILITLLKLPFLKCRFGWLLMWTGITLGILFFQTNMGQYYPQVFGDIGFPEDKFGVARNFPLLSDGDQKISANHVYYKQSGDLYARGTQNGPLVFESKNGNLVLSNHKTGKILASTKHNVNATFDKQDQQAWTINGREVPRAKVGLRKGKHLQEELLGFAKDRDIEIGKILMIEGSHTDARANAFVTGLGPRIIGLYDTLFLGESAASDTAEKSMFGPEGDMSLEKIGESVTGVDTTEEEGDTTPLLHNAPMKAMSDDQILAILGHELGHAAMRHVESGMVVQALTTFVEFAAWGWMAQSPLVASAFAFQGPSVHGGLFVFDHVGGPPLAGGLKFLTDGQTRVNEYEADAYSAKVSPKYADNLQTALAKLAVNSNQDPDEPYFYEVLHHDHPSTAKRWAAVEEVKGQ